MSPSSAPAGGGGGTAQKQTRQVAIHVKITAGSSSAVARNPKYVSPATNGVLVQVYTSPRASNPTIIGVSATDVSAGSAACGGATGTRTCTIYIPAPAGTDDFVFTTYDQPPTGGSTTFPAGSNILAVGVVTQTISLGSTNTVSVALGGEIASLSVVPLATSASAGSASSYNLAITGYDADGNAIVAGAADPYYNPITVAVSEVGGSGNTSVTLGGSSGSGSASVQISQTAQTATVLYTGGGTSGYGAQIAVSAQGATTVNAAFGPFFVSSSSPYYVAASSTVSFTSPSQTAVMNLAEYGFGGTFTATAGPSCTGIATVSTPAAGTPSSATITAGPNSGSCTVTFSDGNVSFLVTTISQSTSSTITIPWAFKGTFNEYTVPTASSGLFGITSGSDGALWFTEANANQIGRITTAGTISLEYPIPNSNSYPWNIVSGADGALWFTEYQAGAVGRLTPDLSYTEFPGLGNAVGIAAGPDGGIWYPTYANSTYRYVMRATSNTFNYYNAYYPYNWAITSGPDGALWYTNIYYNLIFRMTTGGVLTSAFGIPTPNSNPYAITSGPDGALWFTEISTNKIGRMSVTGSFNEYVLPTPGSSPWGIVSGPDGALWFTEYGGAKIGRITTAGAITEYPIPTPGSGPVGITVGPDGAIWFTEFGANKVGRLH